jgi:hypothetical protein
MSMTLAALLLAAAQGAPPENTWVKLTPLEGTPTSPRLGYEGACAWDSRHRRLLRYGGHNQGGGGEQHSEVWTFDPATARWELKETNTSPPGICCGQQNLYDPAQGRYLRFPSFSGSHGWQWSREIYLNDSSVWTYDLSTNRWRNMRPIPQPRLAPLRGASWDDELEVAVVFGGEGGRDGTVVYDPYVNTWTWPKPPVEPEPRSGGNMAYDSGRNVHVFFGSQFTNDPHTWTYSVSRNTWRDMQPEAQPPTDKNDAVLSYDPSARKVVAIVKASEGKDEQEKHALTTWTYDAEANKWERMSPAREPDASGNRARNIMFAPQLGVTLLENCTGKPREQQVWMYRLPPAKVEPAPSPPVNVRVTTGEGSATVSWDPSPSPDLAQYAIYRGALDPFRRVSPSPIAGVPAEQRTYKDTGLAAGTPYVFFVCTVDGKQRRSEPSARARTQPRAIDDVRVSVLSPREIEVAWPALAADDVAAYHVDRAPVEVLTEDQLKRLKSRTPPLTEPSVGAIRRVGHFVRLTPAPVRASPFVDRAVDLTKPEAIAQPAWEKSFGDEALDKSGRPYRFAVYAYRVAAVNALGVEGGPSSAVFTIPSIPQYVFSREEGTTCHLKWAANPEKGIRGYRVYRMDGRWDKDTITRLTPEALDATTFSDPGAGKSSRRYYIVAVDALGQEGHPSSPVWFEREWKKYYIPFTAEWHQ